MRLEHALAQEFAVALVHVAQLLLCALYVNGWADTLYAYICIFTYICNLSSRSLKSLRSDRSCRAVDPVSSCVYCMQKYIDVHIHMYVYACIYIQVS